jgi:hypothetical protein
MRPRKIWRRDIKNRQVSFFLDGASLGSAATDDDGTATVEWTPPGIGAFSIEARFDGDEKFAAGTDSLLCAVRSPERPTVILDIDHTLSQTSNWNVIRGRVDDLPLEHSQEVAPKLAAAHDIVYMTARPNKFLDVTKRWLAHWGFARYPIFLLDLKKYPSFDEAKYKTETLAAIKASFPDVVLGIGDKQTDAEAYRAHGLRALIIGDTGGVVGAEAVADWLEIDGLLFSAPARSFRRLHHRTGVIGDADAP